MRRGDIHDADLGGPAGRRPVVIITRDGLIPILSNVTVVEITRTVRELPTELPLNRPEHGLDGPSVANAVNIHTVPKSAIKERRGELSGMDVAILGQALMVALELDAGPRVS